MKYFYGPVQSRRLGLSLGVDLCGEKQCSLDCLYCQVGRTSNVTLSRFENVDIALFTNELKELLKQHPDLDYITFAGSGEPTLHKGFGAICELIKSLAPKIKLALITNSTLLTDSVLRDEIKHVDLLVPSLDAAMQSSFEKINRPAPGLKVVDIINALKYIKKQSNIEMWLEIMLLGGVNDSVDDLLAIKDAVLQIQPDKVQINLPVRPTLEQVRFPDVKIVDELISLLQDHVEIICDKKIEDKVSQAQNLEESLISYVSRRPAAYEDLMALLGLEESDLIKMLDSLIRTKNVQVFEHQGKVFVKAYEVE